MKRFFSLVALSLATLFLSAQEPFITTWKTDNPGETEDNQILIPVNGTTIDYTVDWGDGTTPENFTGEALHTYSEAGTYTVSITGDLTELGFANASNGGDREKLLSVEQWGELAWTSMSSAFWGCSNLVINATDAPDLSSITSMSQMFKDASSMNSSIDHWDVSTITNMSQLFDGAESFDQPLNSWDVSAVTNMNGMFNGATSFNQPLNNWDVSSVIFMSVMFAEASSFDQDISSWSVGNVTDFSGMFANASSFNSDLSSWDVSSATNMGSMFSGATSFDQPINNWDVSNVQKMSSMFFGASALNQDLSLWNTASVTEMNNMFSNASSFNQDVSVWNVGNVTDMGAMFYLASSFDQNVGAWDVSAVTNMSLMFSRSGLSIENYDATLTGWASQTLQNDISLGALDIIYCGATSSRQTLIDTYNWTITGDERCTPFITIWKTDNPGVSADNEITIPTTGAGYNYDVDWGDGEVDTGVTGNITHTYSTAGTYTVSISGDFPRIHFDNSGDRQKIISIEQWGQIGWTSMNSAFSGCSNLVLNASDAPDLSGVTDMYQIFRGDSLLNTSIDHWDVSTVNDLGRAFMDAIAFNQPLSSWDVSNVTNMNSMFEGATSFNQTLNDWDVSSVQTAGGMFKNATSFNQPIDSWSTSNITLMTQMFWNASVFNQDISSWDVSSVTNMSNMFFSASAFNQPLDSWNVSNVTNMKSMFAVATSFNMPINSWDVGSVTDMTNMFYHCGSFDQPLNSWNTSQLTSMNGIFRGASSFNQPLDNWDVSNVTEMINVFNGALAFNQNLNNWDVSNVTKMWFMFANTEEFDQPLDQWDVSNVEETIEMFSRASSFNQPLNTWNTSSLIRPDAMFREAGLFNQPLDNWNTSNVTSMSNMFESATSFNQPLDTWDVQNVTDMRRMFLSASSFDQSLENWNISNVTDFTSFIDVAGISSKNYDQTLYAWSQLPTLQSDINFGAVLVYYCTASDARQKIIDDFNWTINDAGQSCSLESLDGRSAAISFIINEKAYFGLGTNSDTTYTDLFEIDPVTNAIDLLADFPGTARSEAVSFVIEGKAYVGSGRDKDGNLLKDFYSYDPTLNEWSQIADLTGEARSSAIAFVLNNEGYIGTGRGASSELSDFWKYNPTTNSWEEITGFTGDARQEAVAFVVANKAYVSGGVAYTGGTTQFSDVQEFDPSSGSWTEKIFADIDLNINSASSFVLKDKAYIAYGNQESIISYDPTNDQIEDLGDVFSIDDGEIGDTRADAISFVVADTAYFGFGSSGFTTTIYYNDLNKFIIPNSAPTDITLSSQAINENEALGTIVGTLTAVDEDTDDSHTFELVEGDEDNHLFDIIDDNLVTDTVFNHEEKSEYTVRIKTTDEQGEAFEKTFTIQIDDVNDAPILTEMNFEIQENIENGVVVGQIESTDEDGDDITLSIVNSTAAGAFDIQSDQLIVVDSSLIDYELNEQIDITIRADDGLATTDIVYNIIITNIDEAPYITATVYDLDENSLENSIAADLAVTDPENDNISISITSGNDEGTFYATGTFILVDDSTLLDFETNPQFELGLELSDGSNQSSTFITINLLDVNEAPSINRTSFTLADNSENNEVVGNLQASDPEGDELQFTIQNETAADAFTIDADGLLLVSNSSLLDADATPVFNFDVEVSDSEFTVNYEITIDVEKALGIQDQTIVIYPNPTSQYLHINGNDRLEPDGNIMIYAQDGKMVLKSQLKTQIEISTLPQGIYTLVILSKEKTFRTKFRIN
ncbi:BspA family leucine-rich repeat surface protein [Ekhidna sp.]|uniref:BspA family leucine-rich repeat surface protein n=1 Tax=Ekhidna sp. TaxID=2608089 RepID=UPI003CCB983A